MTVQQQALDNYLTFYQQMKREDLTQLPTIFTPQARFKDPFNDVYGVERIAAIFYHMFDTLSAPRFVVDESMLEGDIAYIKWQFIGTLKNKPFQLTGVSRVVFDEQGLVSEHIDYWDASEQFYMKIPVLGGLLRLVRRQVAV